MNARQIAKDLEERDLLEQARKVARKYHVTLDELLGRGHGALEARARHELWATLYEEMPTFAGLGRIFGRDHATIVAAVRKYRARHPVSGDSATTGLVIERTGSPVGSETLGAG